MDVRRPEDLGMSPECLGKRQPSGDSLPKISNDRSKWPGVGLTLESFEARVEGYARFEQQSQALRKEYDVLGTDPSSRGEQLSEPLSNVSGTCLRRTFDLDSHIRPISR
jgi:hypothetical protein